MTNGDTWLVTGAARGVGLGIVKALLAAPGTTVIAAVRQLTDEISELLHTLPTGENSKVLVVKVDASSESDASDAMELLKRDHGVHSIDMVLSVAGMSDPRANTLHTTKVSMEDHFRVNTIAPLLLFQTMLPLLTASKKTPKFIVVSSIVSSMCLTEQFPHASTAYGASKAALNYVIGRIHCENSTLVTAAIHPGWVQTDMGNVSAVAAGMEKAPVSIEQSVQGILSVVEGAQRTGSNKFISFDGSELPW
ncbi:hypothetical protein F4808DRAFT_379218 [Astrocystis sublimbata]|nr:hypothetical protein F4808DRAFT_379218 [Astrocystis sublimbata]